MVELKTLEELRTRREIEDYFKQLGKNITEKEIDVLKQSYDKTQESGGDLTLDQLNDVAGGMVTRVVFIDGANLYDREGETLLGSDLLEGYFINIPISSPANGICAQYHAFKSGNLLPFSFDNFCNSQFEYLELKEHSIYLKALNVDDFKRFIDPADEAKGVVVFVSSAKDYDTPIISHDKFYDKVFKHRTFCSGKFYFIHAEYCNSPEVTKYVNLLKEGKLSFTVSE